MTELERIKRITDMRDKNRRYEKEIADLGKIVERLDAENKEIKNIKTTLEDKNKYLAEHIEKLDAENNELKDAKADLKEDNRYLAERVGMLEHKRDELLDELKRVGDDRERDFTAGKIAAYREAIRTVLDLVKE